MSERHPCSALINGKCKNLFPVTAACSPWQGTDGSWQGGTPFCMNETLTARLYPETGGPPLLPESHTNR